MNFFIFGKKDYEYIVEECMLNKEYAKILEMEIKGYSRKQIADEIGQSMDNLDKMIRKLKDKIKKVL